MTNPHAAAAKLRSAAVCARMWAESEDRPNAYSEVAHDLTAIARELEADVIVLIPDFPNPPAYWCHHLSPGGRWMGSTVHATKKAAQRHRARMVRRMRVGA